MHYVVSEMDVSYETIRQKSKNMKLALRQECINELQRCDFDFVFLKVMVKAWLKFLIFGILKNCTTLKHVFMHNICNFACNLQPKDLLRAQPLSLLLGSIAGRVPHYVFNTSKQACLFKNLYWFVPPFSISALGHDISLNEKTSKTSFNNVQSR